MFSAAIVDDATLLAANKQPTRPLTRPQTAPRSGIGNLSAHVGVSKFKARCRTLAQIASSIAQRNEPLHGGRYLGMEPVNEYLLDLYV